MDQPVVSPVDVQVTWADKQAFMEVIRGIQGDELALILHSPGGQIEAAQSIVEYIRSKFSRVTAIVPDAAMSAATLIALSADKILMGRQSNLGPIDPQFMIPLQNTLVPISAQSLLEEFERARKEVKHDRDSLLVWAPKIQQYPPGILEEARNAIELTKKLGREWLARYMLKDEPSANKIAGHIVNYLSNHKQLRSHATPIRAERLKELGLVVENLEEDQKLQDLVLSVYHAARITFQSTLAHKIVENSDGRAFIRIVSQYSQGTVQRK
ncbi:SDH family Clp fold serine proteinase [Conexivisphaera calida]|uniref:Periplasmic serine protease n=1 Tax=Conexivisphaera calida TaxID=1874277 RepID=A0A4P2VDV6_9ARCH|nr:ATP-dependent Clp protease proteolytic subunit [Conexivisphaera calida]BBE42789.1 periplasmic serine protease [Conexivisphaera calida]